MKRIRTIIAVCLVLLFAFALVACEEKQTTPISSEKKEKTPTPKADEPTPTTPAKTPEDPTPTPKAEDPKPTDKPAYQYDEYGYIKKYSMGDDAEQGIYAIVVTYSDLIPDKGTLTYLYYNDETGVETTVCTYTLTYEKDSNGKYEAHGYYNGQVDINYHQQAELKINITFGAMTRAKRCELFLEANGQKTKIYEFVSKKANK